MLALIPPMTQLNTPYPSTAYLTGFLRSRGIAALQEDLALTLVLDLLTAPHLATIAEQARALPKRRRSESVAAFLDALPKHLAVVAPVLRFLQGDDPTLAHRIAARTFLPEGPRFAALERFDGSDSGGDPLAWAFGALGVQDRARHLATLYLNDLADVIRDVADPRFEFVRYAESLAASQSSFEPLAAALAAPETLVDATLRAATTAALARHRPHVVLLSVPFPGTVYAAFRIAQTIKKIAPKTVIVLGGGYVNTELRELAEPRVFDFFDYVTLDDGERHVVEEIEH
ncbi:MAG: radical SAM protein, partial [Gammaproteobacteria bacterium]|nr:radical SAM protein [Gammaproteobacteria bacterium]